MTKQTELPGTGRTAESILESIAEMFAEKGYDGARVDDLAKAAGVNKATLYYQIGDKEALYHAVLERAFCNTADAIEAAMQQSNDCEEQIRHFVGVFAQATGNIRYTAPILLREIASGGRNLPDVAVKQMGRILGAITGTLEKGIEQGVFRRVNGFMVHMMIVGGLTFYAANEPIRHRAAQHNPENYSPEQFISNTEAGEQIAELVLAAIRNPHSSPQSNKD